MILHPFPNRYSRGRYTGLSANGDTLSETKV